MKIKDLPEDLKELALLRMKEYGSTPHEEYYLDMAFYWEKTEEGEKFWRSVNKGIFPEASTIERKIKRSKLFKDDN